MLVTLSLQFRCTVGTPCHTVVTLLFAIGSERAKTLDGDPIVARAMMRKLGYTEAQLEVTITITITIIITITITIAITTIIITGGRAGRGADARGAITTRARRHPTWRCRAGCGQWVRL
jgi:hypothetical protein